MKDYLKLGDKSYRVEVNWNATVNYSERKGIEEMSQLDELGKMKPRDITAYIWACIQEGERMDGRTLGITEIDLGGLMNDNSIKQFVEIYIKQVKSDTGEAPVKKKPAKKMFGLR